MRKKMLKTVSFCLILILPTWTFAQPIIQTPNEPSHSYEKTAKRRDMLDKHQIWGLAAWAFWLATNIEGEAVSNKQERVGQNYMDILLLSDPQLYTPLYLLHQKSARYESTRSSGTHVSLASATWFTYAVASYYAFTSPPAFEEVKREGFDSIFFHKLLAIIHLGAMLALPALAKGAEENGPSGVQKMRNVGWAGFGAYSIAIGTFYF